MRPRLLPMALGAMTLLLGVKLQGLMSAPAAPALSLVSAARANAEPKPAQPSAVPARPPAPAPPPEAPTPEQQAERAVLEGLRARRVELDGREQAMAAREMVLAAAERRLTQRIEELTVLQQRLQATDRTLGEREEAGWRQMVKLYEGMRPRDAAAIFDELEMPVLLQILDRMGDRKAAPVVGAMKHERARLVTAELARLRAHPKN